MKRIAKIVLVVWIASMAAAIAMAAPAPERPWQRLTMPTVRIAEAGFRATPPEYGMVLWWFWNGGMTEAEISRDLDDVQAHGVKSVIVWAYYGLEIEYLSDKWFARIKYAVAEARKRNLRVWLMDEGGYPSGFAGGEITRGYPQYRMKALVTGRKVTAKGSKELSLDLGAQTLGAWAVERGSNRIATLPLEGGKIRWRVPAGEWEITPVEWQYRTPPTRYVSNPGFPKNRDYSLFDFLDPEAARQVIALVHEKYKRAIGEEFGKTVMGFMSDEPECYPVPWTGRSLEEFRRVKGYDLLPHVASLLMPAPPEAERRVQADYYDVWSAMLREAFFKVQADWCAANGLEYIAHLSSDSDLPKLAPGTGDYFRAIRNVHVPGVDAIWRQIWPGTVADFPKLASSAAHLYGRPRAFSESFAVYGRGLTLEQAKWVMDYQLVRGINLFQTMLMLSDSRAFREYFHPPDWRLSPQWEQFGMLAAYSNRATYLLSQGKPAARVALFYPSANVWLGDAGADGAAFAAARQLMEQQRDFDFIDEQALAETSAVERYRAVVVPGGSVLSRQSLERLKAFARGGGRVVWAGKKPGLVYDRTFRDATAPEAIDWGMEDTASDFASSLGESDVRLEKAFPAVKVLHRRWADADAYFFFNESADPVKVGARLDGAGAVTEWDAASGKIRLAQATEEVARVRLTLALEGYETRFVVVGATPAQAGVRTALRTYFGTAAEVKGEWHLRLGTREVSAALKTWSDLGFPEFMGAGVYRTSFEMPGGAARAERRMLDLGEVRYSARVRLNGRDLGARAWRPFRWDVTEAARPGRNEIEVEVRNTAANELAGDPARLREVERLGWLKNSYIGFYGKFDAEMVPAGLMGPVRIELWR